MEPLNKSGEIVAEVQQTNFITLLKNPEKFRETFQQLQNTASLNLKSQQYDKALKSLTKCMDMLDLGKNILKDNSKYNKLCINANIACAYQGRSTWKMQKCNKFCEKTEEQLQKLLLQSGDSKQNYLGLTKALIRIRFQHCAILSQLNQHQKALQLCKSTLGCLDAYVKSILEYAQSLYSHQRNEEGKFSETVEFSRQVSTFAEQILRNLLKNLNEPLTQTKDKSSFYYWQRNPENNEDQVKKRFVSGKPNDECKRSILGVNKMTHWIDQFNIGTIMHMSELSVKEFENPLPIEEFIFKDKLYETVIYCSVAHFTIATEMRFIESNRDKEKEKDKDKDKENKGKAGEEELRPPALVRDTSANIQSIIKKYGVKQKSQMFMMSQLYHLRAIHIIAQNIKSTVPYISHLIKSYDKHYIYKKQLEPVVAIDEQSMISVNQLNSFKKIQKKEDQFQQEDEYLMGEEEDKEIAQELEYEKEFQVFTSFKNQKVAENYPISHENGQRLDTLEHEKEPSELAKSKKRNKSQGRIAKTAREKNKSRSKFQKIEQPDKKPKKTKQKSTKTIKESKAKPKKSDKVHGELHINHQSTTQIKVVFKKKK